MSRYEIHEHGETVAYADTLAGARLACVTLKDEGYQLPLQIRDTLQYQAELTARGWVFHNEQEEETSACL